MTEILSIVVPTVYVNNPPKNYQHFVSVLTCNVLVCFFTHLGVKALSWC